MSVEGGNPLQFQPFPRLEILEKDGKDFLFISEVHGGTYIRKLVDDLGKNLGIGAHMLELRRIRAGIFKEEISVSLYDFSKAVEELKNDLDRWHNSALKPGESAPDLMHHNFGQALWLHISFLHAKNWKEARKKSNKFRLLPAARPIPLLTAKIT